MKRLHAVLLTLPFSGHMNPMLHLARRLASIPDAVRRVTFVISNSVQHRSLSFWQPPQHHDADSCNKEEMVDEDGNGELRFVYIPDGTQAEDYSRCDALQLLQIMEKNYVRHFEADVLVPLLLRNHQKKQPHGEAQECNGDEQDDEKVVVIGNAVIPGADRAARKHGVPFVAFWPQSAASFAHILHIVGHGYRPPHGTPPTAAITIPGVPVPVPLQDFNAFLQSFDPENYMYRLAVSSIETSRNADCLVINTFEELEMVSLASLRQEIKPLSVMAIGPLLPDWFFAEIRKRKGHKVWIENALGNVRQSTAPSHATADRCTGKGVLAANERIGPSPSTTMEDDAANMCRTSVGHGDGRSGSRFEGSIATAGESIWSSADEQQRLSVMESSGVEERSGATGAAPDGDLSRSESSEEQRQEDSKGRDTEEEEWRRCMEWLEAQEEETVVYVSFGSMASAGEEQAKEMAKGLEGSGAKFVWSLKNKEKVVEKGWEERMEAEGRGLVMEWAPQLALLAHPAIAAFLTHCGWNSTIEAMSAGVPMLAWRTGVSDQAFNARLAADAWHHAILLDSSSSSSCSGGGGGGGTASLVSGDEVRRNISKLFELKRDGKMAEEPKRWCRAAAAAAAAESGLRRFALTMM